MAARRFSILFITQSRIGDAVLSSGLVKALAEEVEDARFTIVASELTAPLFAEVPGLERIIVMEKRPGGAHWFHLWRRARLRRWGLVVDLRGSPLASVLQPRRRAVHRRSDTPVHKVIEAARLLKMEETPPSPYLFTSEATEARADALTAGEGPILAVGPCANWIGKTWPAERFARLAHLLLDAGGPLAGGRLMVVGGPDDRRAAGAVLSAAPRERVIDLVGREDLLTVYSALKRVRLFIGCDSGLMHLAAAAGAPTLGLFGPSDERLYAPWGPHAKAVRGSRDFETFKRIDPRLDQEISHMMDLGIDTVARAATELLAQTADEPPIPSPTHADTDQDD
ncbi:MAG TPA: glycosyltransferase family 9 protein [Caulobacteraceae bacterium]|jgi:ADP-heptose:LPS heptosyltransferase|nr:glycosyltransferase family 9 protein [Caulobacteraceae bacterium]